MHADDDRLGAHLVLPDSPARRLLKQADRLMEIQRRLRDWAGEPLAASLSVANQRERILVIHVASAAALTQLRFRREELLAFLRPLLDLPDLHVEMKVRTTAHISR